MGHHRQTTILLSGPCNYFVLTKHQLFAKQVYMSMMSSLIDICSLHMRMERHTQLSFQKKIKTFNVVSNI